MFHFLIKYIIFHKNLLKSGHSLTFFLNKLKKSGAHYALIEPPLYICPPILRYIECKLEEG